MNLSCCIWALSGPEDVVLANIAAAGFKWIDIQPNTLTGLHDLDLQVSCIGISFGLPEGVTLDSPDSAVTARAGAHLEQALNYGAQFGATTAYVVPGRDSSQAALDRYARTLTTAADQAAALGMKLCIEHFPGMALPTVTATLDFINALDHPNLYLLYDIGHVQMVGDDPAGAIIQAGSRLGYVHLDDNDGQGDLHWSLLDGVLTEETLQRTFAALAEVGYTGSISLELHPALPDPLAALKKSREIVMKLEGVA